MQISNLGLNFLARLRPESGSPPSNWYSLILGSYSSNAFFSQKLTLKSDLRNHNFGECTYPMPKPAATRKSKRLRAPPQRPSVGAKPSGDGTEASPPSKSPPGSRTSTTPPEVAKNPSRHSTRKRGEADGSVPSTPTNPKTPPVPFVDVSSRSG